VSAAVRALLESGAGESVKPGDARLLGSETRMIVAPQMALEAAAQVARAAGLAPHILGDSLEGEARELGTAIDDSWTDAQAWGLIFEAGFSTAKEVTNLSGRGVGMDVVRRFVQLAPNDLRGFLGFFGYLVGSFTALASRAVRIARTIICGLVRAAASRQKQENCT